MLMSSTMSLVIPRLFSAAVARVLANEGDFGARRSRGDQFRAEAARLSGTRYGETPAGRCDRDLFSRFLEGRPLLGTSGFDRSQAFRFVSRYRRGTRRSLSSTRAARMRTVVIEDGALGNGTVSAARRAPGCALLAALPRRPPAVTGRRPEGPRPWRVAARRDSWRGGRGAPMSAGATAGSHLLLSTKRRTERWSRKMWPRGPTTVEGANGYADYAQFARLPGGSRRRTGPRHPVRSEPRRM